MFTRPMSGTADIAEQGVLLNEVSRLVDDGTLAGDFGPINATNPEARLRCDRKRQGQGQDRPGGFAT